MKTEYLKIDEAKKIELPKVIEQYLDIKAQNQNSIVLFRLGEFYETYFDDAITLSKICEIALTKRKLKVGCIAMAGIPATYLENYIEKLLEADKIVSICEQTQSQKDGILEREIVRTYSKGTILEGKLLKNEQNNYICAIFKENNEYGISYQDISTGDFFTTKCTGEELISEIEKINPSEILLPVKTRETEAFTIVEEPTSALDIDFSKWNVTLVKKSIFSNNLIKGNHVGYKCANAIMTYVLETQKQFAPKFSKIKDFEIENYLMMDEKTRKSLELTRNSVNSKKYGSIHWVLDMAQTSMGKRLLADWLNKPLKNKNEITKRHDAIDEMFKMPDTADTLQEILANCYDIKRMWGKATNKTLSQKDFLALCETLKNIGELKKILPQFKSELINFELKNFENLENLAEIIERTIAQEDDGKLIKDGASANLDFIRHEILKIKNEVQKYEENERQKTEIKSLKVNYNKISGYFIEISKQAKNVPLEYQVKQNLSNVTRYVTCEIIDFEKRINSETYKAQELEADIFKKLKEYTHELAENILEFSEKLAQIDVLQAFYRVSKENKFVRPTFSKNGEFEVIKGFHPTCKKMNKNFIKNDFYEDDEKFFVILTGANMAGKSTYLRQNAIIAILCQMGCYVSAASANLPIFDKIYASMGNFDELINGNSTFMVEMQTVKEILENSTQKSLILLDEPSRGTSTNDGLALTSAICCYIIENKKAKTLLATHFHKLSNLIEKYPKNVENLMIGENFDLEKGCFDRHVKRGFLSKSYGINVAKMAGLPPEIIENARKMTE